jgi:hypothetical protein
MLKISQMMKCLSSGSPEGKYIFIIIYIMPKKEPTAPPLYPVLAHEDNGITFRLNQISEIRNFLESENEARSRLRRRYKSIYNTFFYISTAFGVIAVGAGTAGMAALGTGIGVPLTLPLGIVSIAMGATSVGASALCKVLLKKVEKHERIKNVAMAKVSSVNKLVSDALKDNNISDEEYKLILAERENYREHKKQIRQKVRNEMIDEIKEAEKKGVEKGKKEALSDLLRTAGVANPHPE